MLSPSLKQMIKGRTREFFREPSASFFVILMPLLWMLILGFAFSGQKNKVYSVGLVADIGADLATKRDHLEMVLMHSEHIKIKSASAGEMQQLFKRNKIQLAVEATATGVTYHLDAMNPESREARLFVDRLVQQGAGQREIVAAEDRDLKLPGGRYIDFFIPGLLGLSIMTSSLFGTGMTIVALRRNKLFKRFCASPVNTTELIVSFIVGRFQILLVEFVTILLAGFLIFKFSVEGNLLAFAVMCMLGAACFTAIGIFAGARMENVGTYNGIVNLMTLPMMILSGVFFSRGNFPEWMEPFLNILPLSPLVEGLRRIALEGAGLADLGLQMAILGAYTVVCIVLAKLTFKWY